MEQQPPELATRAATKEESARFRLRCAAEHDACRSKSGYYRSWTMEFRHANASGPEQPNRLERPSA
jgi:hypothetical protein